MFRAMAQTGASSQVLQGVLAVNKPQGITSSGLVGKVQTHFTQSTLFAPLLDSVRAARAAEASTHSRRKRDRRPLKVKIGHGGTLDPLATGVLIVGIGKGTKSLGEFISCTKSYECVVLFGVESDTYDVLGNPTHTGPSDFITRERIEEALAQFRGKLMQRPPIYSAKRINGERMYDIARSGGEIPENALKECAVEVSELELLNYWKPSQHSFAMKPLEERQSDGHKEFGTNRGAKRKRDGDSPAMEATKNTKTASVEKDSIDRPRQEPKSEPEADTEPTATTQSEASYVPEALSIPGPAARLRMTVTSGFYVRSLCHDLGKTLSSAAVMAELVRTRQGEFELGKNVLAYEELEKGEDVWGPRVKGFLNEWQQSKDEA